jgi:hypothetical protein
MLEIFSVPTVSQREGYKPYGDGESGEDGMDCAACG